MPPRSAKRRVAGPGSRRAARGRGKAAKPLVQTHVQAQLEESTVEVDGEVEVVEAKIEEEVNADKAEDAIAEVNNVEIAEKVTEEETLEDKSTEVGASKKEDEVLEEKKAAVVAMVTEEEVAVSDAKFEEDILEGTEVETTEKLMEQTLEENEDDPVEKNHYAKELNDENEKDEKLDLEDNDPDYEPEEYDGVYFDEREMEQYHHEGGRLEEYPDEVLAVQDEKNGVESLGVNEELEPVDDNELVEEEHAEIFDAVEDEEHTEVFKERRKRKEFEIFIGGLDKDATESDLRKVFSEVGDIIEVRLMMNPQTKKNKGFAFLRYATAEQAKRACIQLKNPVVHGKQCGVTPSQDSDTLFLGNICRTWTKETLKEKLKYYDIENIEDLTLVEDSNNAGMNRGFAFLEFSSRPDAMVAFKQLQKREVVFGVDRPAKVSFADSFIDPGDEIMSQVKTVFVDGLSTSWDVEHIKELLKMYGNIEKVELSKDMPTARRKDFGFVTFDSHDAAVTCAKSINNEELGEGDKKAKVRARLSRPLQRGKGKHIARGDFKPGRGPLRGGTNLWSHNTVTRGSSQRGPRGARPRPPPPVNRGFNRSVDIRETRPTMVAHHPRHRPVTSLPRPYERRPSALSYNKGDLKRDYGHREEFHPRSRPAMDFRAPSDRRLPYRDDFPRPSGYPDMYASRSPARRYYSEDGYGQGYERPPPSFVEGRPRDYDPLAGTKRPYAAVVDVPPGYTESEMRHSRARLDYDFRFNAHYSDAYGDRFGRSNVGYGGGRSYMPSQESHGLYNSHQGMGYSRGSYSRHDASRMHSSSFGGSYKSRRVDVGSSSYSSDYPGRSLGDSRRMGSNAGSYY